MWAHREVPTWGIVDTSERIVVKREPRRRRSVAEKRGIAEETLERDESVPMHGTVVYSDRRPAIRAAKFGPMPTTHTLDSEGKHGYGISAPEDNEGPLRGQ